MMEINSQHAVLLVLLDLSAAFDTVDRSVLLRRLQTSFGISGAPLDWFKSYLSARSQRVSIPGALSDSLPLDWGVPQGSCLGPLLYVIYSSKLFNIIERPLQILTVMRMIHKYISPSSPMTCQVNKML